MSKLSKSIERQHRILEEISTDFDEYKKQTEARKSKGYVNACLTDVDELFKGAKSLHTAIVSNAAEPQK